MEIPPKKPPKATRTQTLKRCEEVADTVTGTETPLDKAFAAFDNDVGADPERLAALQEHVRALLRGSGS